MTTEQAFAEKIKVAAKEYSDNQSKHFLPDNDNTAFKQGAKWAFTQSLQDMEKVSCAFRKWCTINEYALDHNAEHSHTDEELFQQFLLTFKY